MNDEQREWIKDLYLEMFDKLMVYAGCNLENEALAEEAVQETFRIACQKPEALCNCSNPRGWLVSTLKNIIRNTNSNRATAKKIIEKYILSQIEEISFHEDRINLSVLYENLADTEEFKLLYESAIEGRSYEEMARSRGITVSACKKRVQRAKENFKKNF